MRVHFKIYKVRTSHHTNLHIYKHTHIYVNIYVKIEMDCWIRIAGGWIFNFFTIYHINSISQKILTGPHHCIKTPVIDQKKAREIMNKLIL